MRRRLEGPRRQFGDTVDWMPGGDLGEDVGQIGFRVDPVQFRGLQDRIHCGGALAARMAARRRANCAFLRLCCGSACNWDPADISMKLLIRQKERSRSWGPDRRRLGPTPNQYRNAYHHRYNRVTSSLLAECGEPMGRSMRLRCGFFLRNCAVLTRAKGPNGS